MRTAGRGGERGRLRAPYRSPSVPGRARARLGTAVHAAGGSEGGPAGEAGTEEGLGSGAQTERGGLSFAAAAGGQVARPWAAGGRRAGRPR